MDEKLKSEKDIDDRGGKEELLAQIREDAKAEADKIIEEARTAADSKIRSAKGRAERLKKDADERAVRKAEEISKSTDSSVKIRKKRLRLQKNEEIVRNVLNEVREALEAEISGPGYREVLKNWVLEAAFGLDVPEIIVAASKAEKKHLDRDLLLEIEDAYKESTGKKIKVRISGESAEEQGIAAYTKDGRLEYRKQVSTIIARSETVFRRMIYKAFGIESGI